MRVRVVVLSILFLAITASISFAENKAIAELNKAISDLTNRVNGIESAAVALTSRVTNVENSVSGLSTADTALSGRVTAAESTLTTLETRVTGLEQIQGSSPNMKGAWILYSFLENEMTEIHQHIFEKAPGTTSWCTATPCWENLGGRVGFDPPKPWQMNNPVCFKVENQNGHEFSGTRYWTQGMPNCPPDNPNCERPNGGNSVPRSGPFKGYIVGNMVSIVSDEVVAAPDASEWIRNFQGFVDFSRTTPTINGLSNYLKIYDGTPDTYYGGYRISLGTWAETCP